jgi:uncharacterized protein DUF3105
LAERTREQERQERRQRIDARAQHDADRDRRRHRRTILRIAIPVGIVAVVFGIVLFIAVKEAVAPLPGEAMLNEGSTHVEVGTPISYNDYPPTSGTHYPTWARWAYSDEAIQPGFWVHNLEHGGIVILYKCPANCDQLKRQLRDLAANLPKARATPGPKIVIAPDERIESPLVALAWNRRLSLDQYDEGQLRGFYQRLVESAAAPEPNAQ